MDSYLGKSKGSSQLISAALQASTSGIVEQIRDDSSPVVMLASNSTCKHLSNPTSVSLSTGKSRPRGGCPSGQVPGNEKGQCCRDDHWQHAVAQQTAAAVELQGLLIRSLNACQGADNAPDED